MPRLAVLLTLPCLLAPSCSVPVSGLDDAGRTAIRVDWLMHGNYDGSHRDSAFVAMPMRTEADFRSDALGLTFEHMMVENLSLLGAARFHDVDSKSGTMSLEDSFQEFSIGGRFYFPSQASITAFGQFDVTMVTGLDPAGDGIVAGIGFGAGAIWWIDRSVSLELMGRLLLAGQQGEESWEAETDIEGTQVLLGLSWWF